MPPLDACPYQYSSPVPHVSFHGVCYSPSYHPRLRNRVGVVRCPHQPLVPLPGTLHRDALAAVILHRAGRPDVPDYIRCICIDDHDDHDRGQHSSCRSDRNDLHVRLRRHRLPFAPLVIHSSVKLSGIPWHLEKHDLF